MSLILRKAHFKKKNKENFNTNFRTIDNKLSIQGDFNKGRCIQGDFTDRSYFNLVPAFEKLKRLVEFESLKEQTFSTTPSIPKSEQTKAISFIRNFNEKIIKVNENEYEIVGTRAKNV